MQPGLGQNEGHIRMKHHRSRARPNDIGGAVGDDEIVSAYRASHLESRFILDQVAEIAVGLERRKDTDHVEVRIDARQMTGISLACIGFRRGPQASNPFASQFRSDDIGNDTPPLRVEPRLGLLVKLLLHTCLRELGISSLAN